MCVCSDAIQTLQAEVTRLKERLEGCLRNKKPLSSVRAAPSAQENFSISTPRVRLVFIFVYLFTNHTVHLSYSNTAQEWSNRTALIATARKPIAIYIYSTFTVYFSHCLGLGSDGVMSAGEEETDRRLMRLRSPHWDEQPGGDHLLHTDKNHNLTSVSWSQFTLEL